MWATTGHCIATWLKVTVVLGVLVLIAGFVWGFGSSAFTLAVLAAILIDLIAVRGLAREWSFNARGSWWWFG
jgi:hypothetical protein